MIDSQTTFASSARATTRGTSPFLRGAIIAIALLIATTAFGSNADLDEANRLFQAQDFEGASKVYAKALSDAVEDGSVWFQYGYSLFRLQKNQEALDAYAKAEERGFESPRMFGTAAMCSARLGKDDQALEQVARAVDLGMGYGPLRSIPEFERIRERPEFRAILAQAEATSFPCRAHEESRQFDFWIGDWSVQSGGGVVGENHITSLHEGCLILESYTTPGGFAGSSFNFYDPLIDAWRQVWIATSGAVTMYEGNLDDEGRMVFHGVSRARSGPSTRVRMTFTPNDDGSVRQFIEASQDEGETWTTSFDGMYVPAE